MAHPGISPQIRKALLSLLLICGLLGGYTRSAAPQADTIRIGVLATLTEDSLQGSGQPTLDGARLAVQELNAAGGLAIAGKQHTIELAIENDRGSPQAAVLAAKKLINQQHIAALIGPQSSQSAIPVAETAERAGVPMISPMSTHPRTTSGKRYVFRIAFLDSFQARAMARFAREQLGAQQAAVLYDIASTYSSGMAAMFRDAFVQVGGRVVAFEHYTTDDHENFGAQLGRIRNSGASVLFLPNLGGDVLTQGRQAREMGMAMTLIGADGWNGRLLAAHEEFEGAFYTHHWAPNSSDPRSQAFKQAYQRSYGRKPLATAALTYDALQLLFQAIRMQDSAEPLAIRDGLASIKHYHGVSGRMSYRGTGNPLKQAVILRITKGKAISHTLIKPSRGGDR